MQSHIEMIKNRIEQLNPQNSIQCRQLTEELDEMARQCQMLSWQIKALSKKLESKAKKFERIRR